LVTIPGATHDSPFRTDPRPHRAIAGPADILPPDAGPAAVAAAAQALAKSATATARLRTYKAHTSSGPQGESYRLKDHFLPTLDVSALCQKTVDR
jgi:hypothetical protein